MSMSYHVLFSKITNAETLAGTYIAMEMIAVQSAYALLTL
jgi:hypothetical protein